MHQHYIIHKPFGYISQFVYTQKRKKKLLGELYPFVDKTMAIGRLDVNSEGLLLLTTDGKLSAEICSSKVEKEYYVQVDGEMDETAIQQLEKGVEIGLFGKRYTTTPCQAKKLMTPPVFAERTKKIRDERHGPTSWASITLREGKYRQVRKMTAAVGFPTLRLIRVRIGGLKLNDLDTGVVIETDDLSQVFQ
mgnify:CR=1 FL=1